MFLWCSRNGASWPNSGMMQQRVCHIVRMIMMWVWMWMRMWMWLRLGMWMRVGQCLRLALFEDSTTIGTVKWIHSETGWGKCRWLLHFLIWHTAAAAININQIAETLTIHWHCPVHAVGVKDVSRLPQLLQHAKTLFRVLMLLLLLWLQMVLLLLLLLIAGEIEQRLGEATATLLLKVSQLLLLMLFLQVATIVSQVSCIIAARPMAYCRYK